ncbi:unnamed protein product [Cyclocybe aegerita]|uniref:F-box domain-containing protein n=1 Tax=Cyclocybe aegerita TaxID=1973307 RepID=A0A8S0X5L1_CYCAE|nr:unnamed protein product [Cyclocybe aegerita]
MYTYPLSRPFQRRHTEPNIFTFYNNTNTTDPRKKAEEIAHIDAEIGHIEDNIVMLVRRRSFLQRKRNTYSPAVRLPTELLALIFDYACLPSSDDAWKDLFMFQHQWAHGATNLGMGLGTGAVTPLFLGTVCSTWRDIAFGTSRLWNAVKIRLNDKHAQQQALLLRQWLTRAGNRPLSIKIVEDETHAHRSDDDEEHDGSGDDDDRWDRDVTSRAVIDVLASFSTQWHTLDLFVPSNWKNALFKVRHALPQLTNLTLRVVDLSTTLARVDAFAHAPALHSVSLVGYSLSDVALPYAQLERLDAEYFTVSECLDALRRCPSLRQCQFHQVDGLGDVEPPPNTTLAFSVRHEQLQALELVMDGKPEMHALLGALWLPALTKFVLSLSDDEPLVGAVMLFLWGAGCVRTLRHLHLVGETPGDEELVEALREMWGLEVLMLINPDSEEGEKLGDGFLEAMDPSKSRRGRDGNMRCLVPLLQKFEYQGAVSFNPHTLVKFLVQRWKPESTYEAYESNHSSTEARRLSQSPVPMDVDSEPEGLSSPHVSALKSVILTTAKKTQFDNDDADTVRRLIEDGMHLEFVKDVNADGPSW